MTTLTIDILDDKALNLIKDLELLKIIRVREDHIAAISDVPGSMLKYKGAMTAQPIKEVNKQLDDLRNEWE